MCGHEFIFMHQQYHTKQYKHNYLPAMCAGNAESIMRKIMQTKFGLGGNCQSATVATLLGIQIDEVPDFWDGCELEEGISDEDKERLEKENGVRFQDNFVSFLAKFGLTSISLGVDVGDHSEWVNSISKALPNVPLLVNGLSPRRYMHSVIWMNGELWHDPHPEGGGVIPSSISFIMPKFEGKPIHPAVKAAFVEGFTMGQEMTENHKTAQPVWQSPQEAWHNSDSEDQLINIPLEFTQDQINAASEYSVSYPDGTLSDETLVNIMRVPYLRG